MPAARTRRKKPKRKTQRRQKPGGGVRPFWSGVVSFGLVSVPVNLFPATRRSRASLRLLAPDGTPLKRRYFCPEHGRDVHPEHILRGYEISEGEYIVVRDEELEAVEPEKTREIDLQRFVDRGEIPPIYFDRPYFLTPAEGGTKAYRLLVEVMEETGRAGIATFVMRTKEYLIAILADQGLLQAETMRFQDELRTPDDVGLPEPPKSSRAAVSSFQKAIAAHTAEAFDRSLLKDEQSQRLQKLVDAKLARGEKPVEGSERPADEDIDEQPPDVDLLETIRRSIQQHNGQPKRRAGGNGRAAPRAGLESQSKDQLYERAQKLDIPGRSRMSKPDLIKAIRRAV